MDDFDRLTIDEWGAIAKAITEKEESRERLQFERTRLLFFASLAPYLDGQTSPQQLLPFAWDESAEKQEDTGKRLTSEDLQRLIQQYAEPAET